MVLSRRTSIIASCIHTCLDAVLVDLIVDASNMSGEINMLVWMGKKRQNTVT
jgi:hypothetical protein